AGRARRARAHARAFASPAPRPVAVLCELARDAATLRPMPDTALAATPADAVAEAAARIRTIRGLQVMLDSDLAALYGVPTRRLLEQVRRNRERFPDDFMFELTAEEWAALRSQNATASSWGGRRTT